jgi:hypothetical protein
MELIQGRRIEVLWEFGESKKKKKVWRGAIVTKPSRSTLTMSPQSAMIRYDAMCSKTDMNVLQGVGGFTFDVKNGDKIMSIYGAARQIVCNICRCLGGELFGNTHPCSVTVLSSR